MKVHHLNCGTMRAIEDPDGRGSLPAVAHCLLLETDDGLVLVETGFGSVDIEAPETALGPDFLGRAAPALRPEETAARQIAALGLDPADVHDIVLTHLDLDHSGGLPDFPSARVHLHTAELDAAVRDFGAHPEDTVRYRPRHWAHGPQWVTHSGSEFAQASWYGFDSAELRPGLRLVPLGGHTAGHCGVAVETDEGWLLHAGDAYYFHTELDPVDPRPHPLLNVLAEVAGVEHQLRQATVARLRELARVHGDEVTVFSAHDPWELARFDSSRPVT